MFVRVLSTGVTRVIAAFLRIDDLAGLCSNAAKAFAHSDGLFLLDELRRKSLVRNKAQCPAILVAEKGPSLHLEVRETVQDLAERFREHVPEVAWLSQRESDGFYRSAVI